MINFCEDSNCSKTMNACVTDYQSAMINENNHHHDQPNGKQRFRPRTSTEKSHFRSYTVLKGAGEILKKKKKFVTLLV